MQFLKPNSLARFQDEPSTTWELAPGVLLERRMFLGWNLGALATITCMPWSHPWSGRQQSATTHGLQVQSRDDISLEELIARIRPQARRLVTSDAPDEEAYIQLALRELAKVATLEPNQFHAGLNQGWEYDLQAYVPPLLLYQIRMQPNAVIELHDHRHHNGALTVREGAIRVRNFDLFFESNEAKWDVAAGVVPAIGEQFLIQEKREVHLNAGQAIGLTRTRENIHQVEAGPDGCLLYDLFTNFKMQAQSFGIDWDGKYFDKAKKLCKVTWIPPDHSHGD